MPKEKKKKPRMRNLNDYSEEDVQNAIWKQDRKRQLKRDMEIEREHQAQLAHPTLAKAIPYIRIGAVIFTCFLFGVVLWIISQVMASSRIPYP